MEQNPTRAAAARAELLARTRRVVVKLGTAVLTNEDGTPALARFESFVESLAELRRSGREVIVVTSGAVGMGAARLGRPAPADLPMRQACAAVGQGRLMAAYAETFERFGLVAAQVLLTRDDFASEERYLNLRRTLTTLLELGAVPVINENDTVATEELGAATEGLTFGDNDQLSALVACKMLSDLLLILTDVDGLYTADPRSGGVARLIPLVEDVTDDVEQLAGEARIGRGGMKTKVGAAAFANRCGCAAIIAGGFHPGVIGRIFAGEQLGTLFLPEPESPKVDPFMLLNGRSPH